MRGRLLHSQSNQRAYNLIENLSVRCSFATTWIVVINLRDKRPYTNDSMLARWFFERTTNNSGLNVIICKKYGLTNKTRRRFEPNNSVWTRRGRQQPPHDCIARFTFDTRAGLYPPSSFRVVWWTIFIV